MFELNEECGVMGVLGDEDASNLIYLGLYALQHRGQEACGIVTLDRSNPSANSASTLQAHSHEVHSLRRSEGSNGHEDVLVHSHKSHGLVADGFSKEALQVLRGDLGIGHNRYSTTGGRQPENIQPFFFNSPAHGPIVLAHNGNLTNAHLLRAELEGAGSIFTSTSDTEVFSHLLARSQMDSLKDKIVDTLSQVRGGYSFVLCDKDQMFAARDPHGLRPLVIGKRGVAFIVASETCALDLIDADYVRDVAPGELVALHRGGEIESLKREEKPDAAFCSFEPIYFSRPDSRYENSSVYNVRKNMGRVLAEEYPVEADLVMAIPDSGVPMAIGYSEATGLAHELGLIRNHYVGRTFIEPSQAIRDFGVKLKLNAVRGVLAGKRVVVIDDSIVRGTTSTKIVRMLRRAGAKEVHFRIGSPPITHSCFYGVSTPDRKRLLAAQCNVEKIRSLLDADSLAYLSPEGLHRALGGNGSGHCMACFTGKYPEDIFAEVGNEPTDGEGPGLFASAQESG